MKTRFFGLQFACWAMVVLCVVAAPLATFSRMQLIRRPAAYASSVSCIYVVCRKTLDVGGSTGRSQVPAEGEIRSALEARLRAPEARRLLASAEFVRMVAELAFLFTLGVALSRLALDGVFERRTVRWLRRAAVVALISAVAEPVAFGLQRTALAPVLTGGLELNFNGNDVFDGLFFAAAASVVAWALEDGLRKRDELAGYV